MLFPAKETLQDSADDKDGEERQYLRPALQLNGAEKGASQFKAQASNHTIGDHNARLGDIFGAEERE